MKRLPILSALCVLATAVQAAERHEWYVLKTDDGAYAFDTESVETDIGSGGKSVDILIGTRAGHSNVEYLVDCHTELVMVDQNVKPADPAWSESGPMKLAADVACGRPVTGAVRVKSESAALAKLKTLSK